MTNTTNESGEDQSHGKLQGQVAQATTPALAPTRIDETSIPSDWWSESSDGQCSEHAALFAASQPAPLNVV